MSVRRIFKSIENFYVIIGGKYSCNIPQCPSIVSSRSLFVKHFRLKHTEEHKALMNPVWVMTDRDHLLLEDFQRVVGGFNVALQFRKFYLLCYNFERKYLTFTYAIMEKDALKNCGLTRRKNEKGRQKTDPCVDVYIGSEFQINPNQSNLPKNYHLGHALGYHNFAITEDHFHLLKLRSCVGPMHRSMNEIFFVALDKCVFKLNAHYDVRVLIGTCGLLSYEDYIFFDDEELQLDEEAYSVQPIPEWWYYVIVVFDKYKNKYKFDAYAFFNVKHSLTLKQCKVTLESLRDASGHPFFENLPFEMERFDVVDETDNFFYSTYQELDRLKMKEIESDAKILRLERENEVLLQRTS